MLVIPQEETKELVRYIYVPDAVVEIFLAKHLNRVTKLDDNSNTCFVLDEGNLERKPSESVVRDMLVKALENMGSNYKIPSSNMTKNGCDDDVLLPFSKHCGILARTFDYFSRPTGTAGVGSFKISFLIIEGKSAIFELLEREEKNVKHNKKILDSLNIKPKQIEGKSPNIRRVALIARHIHIVGSR